VTTTRSRLQLLFIAAILLLPGCGSNKGASTSPTSTASTSAGDIADTANYLTYQAHAYSLKYVEGWGIQQSGDRVTISDKDSAEKVAIYSSRHSTVTAFAAADLARLHTTAPLFHLIARRIVHLAPGNATYAQYRTLSAQDPVTGKRVPVIVDRYYIPGPGKVAALTLSTPVGVDNVDAFRLIARSFRWH
jgi:hypothetical protein